MTCAPTQLLLRGRLCARQLNEERGRRRLKSKLQLASLMSSRKLDHVIIIEFNSVIKP